MNRGQRRFPGEEEGGKSPFARKGQGGGHQMFDALRKKDREKAESQKSARFIVPAVVYSAARH